MSTIKKEANRELDAKVAERVMGWELFKCNYFSSQEESPRQTKLEPWINKVGITDVGDYFIDVDSDFWISVDEWHPSTDISAAWAVVGRMEGLYGFDAHNGFTIINNKRDYSGWYVEFPLPNWEYAEASTAPEAICLAALKAVDI